MEKVTDLEYDREDPDLIWLEISTEDNKYHLNGFESMFVRHIDKVLRSDFVDKEVYFRDQPYQKLTMSKTEEGILELNLSYEHRERDDAKMEVEKERFKKYLKEVREALN